MRTLAVIVALAFCARDAALAQSFAGPCSPRTPVPVDTLRALTQRLHPDATAPEKHNAFMVIGLVFDADCHLVHHAVGQRRGPASVDTILTRLIPETAANRYVISGFVEATRRTPAEERRRAAAGDSIVDLGTPWIVWAVKRRADRH